MDKMDKTDKRDKMNENSAGNGSDFFSIKEICTWTIAVLVLVLMSVIYDVLHKLKTEVMRCIAKGQSILKNDEDDVSVVDISGMKMDKTGTKMISIGETFNHLLNWEMETDATVYFHDEVWSSNQKIGVGNSMRIGKSTGYGIVDVDCEIKIDFIGWMNEGRKEILCEEKMIEDRMDAMMMRTRKSMEIRDLMIENLFHHGIQERDMSEDWEVSSPSHNLTPNRARSLQVSSEVHADDGKSQTTRKGSGSRSKSRFESSSSKRRDGNSATKAHNGKQTRPNKNKQEDKREKVHGSNQDVKYGCDTWFYNKRIERRMKRERKEKREKKNENVGNINEDEGVKQVNGRHADRGQPSSSQQSLQRRQRCVVTNDISKTKEIEEDWKSGSNIELGIDEILRDMVKANVSWLRTHPEQDCSSRRGVRRNVRKSAK